MSVNKVILIGRVGAEPEIRYITASSDGNAKVANIRLATSDYYTDRNGQKQEQTTWHNIVLWRNRAEIAEKYVHKGQMLFVEGKLQVLEYTDKNGERRQRVNIVAENVQMIGGKTPEQYKEPSIASAISGGSGYVEPSKYAATLPTSVIQKMPAQEVSASLPDDDLPF